MKHEKLFDAMQHISDRHLAEAAGQVRGRIRFRIGLIAAVLAVVISVYFIHVPALIFAGTVSAASPSRLEERPNYDAYADKNAFRADLDAYIALQEQRSDIAAEANAQLRSFFQKGSAEFLSGQDQNPVWSPVNAYIGLAMAAEIAGGNSRQQILDLFNTSNIATLRSQVSAVWESIYQDDGNEICILGNSLWIDDETRFHQEAADALSYHYYADVFQANLVKPQTGKDIQNWLNNHTGGLLKDQVKNITLTDDMILALYSTIYFQAKWSDEFDAAQNTTDVFHSPGGDTTATYMNAQLRQMNYYWGKNFSAVALSLKNGSRMWFILPDEGSSPNEVLSDGEYLDMIADTWENSKYMKVNLTIPKFDVTAQLQLRQGLEKLGVTDIFDMAKADLSGGVETVPAWFSAANQATRVQIDETGVKAAAYIELPACGSAAPPEEIIDFVLDRPFLFVITSSQLPLFAGVVNEP